MAFLRVVGIGLCCAQGLLVAACSNEGAGGQASGAAASMNVLLITVDTLRADSLGTYGYARETSPRIDEFALGSTVFERAYATSSWTLPTLASLVTSTYPATHKTDKNHSSLSPSFETLGEALSSRGLRTGAVSSHIFLAERYGLHQGVQEHDEELVHQFKNRNASHDAITSEQITAKASAWTVSYTHPEPTRPY